MVSDSWKKPLKCAYENFQKNIAKSTENMKLSTIFSDSEALTIHPIKCLRPLFQSQLFLSLNFFVTTYMDV